MYFFIKRKYSYVYPQYPAVHIQIKLTQKGNCFQFILCLLFNWKIDFDFGCWGNCFDFAFSSFFMSQTCVLIFFQMFKELNIRRHTIYNMSNMSTNNPLLCYEYNCYVCQILLSLYVFFYIFIWLVPNLRKSRHYFKTHKLTIINIMFLLLYRWIDVSFFHFLLKHNTTHPHTTSQTQHKLFIIKFSIFSYSSYCWWNVECEGASRISLLYATHMTNDIVISLW